MAATIRHMGDPNTPLPDCLVVDTSLLLALITPQSRPSHVTGVAFLNKIAPIARNYELLILVPVLVIEECFYKLIQWYYLSQGYTSRNWHSDGYKQNPHLITNVLPQLRSFHQDVKNFPITIVGPDDLIATVASATPTLDELLLANIDAFQILPKDAYIFAEAQRLWVDTVATLDGDWNRADGFTVIAP